MLLSLHTPMKGFHMTAAPTARLAPHDPSLAGARAWFEDNGLTRPRKGRLLGGATAAIARRFGINLLVARVAMVVGAIVLTPLLYLPLWVLMPNER
jgi:phage shock protein PspC (stress-responsive transcriptional regulator)